MGKQIFIVEDEPDLVSYYRMALDFLGHQVVGFAQDGAAAVAAYGQLQNPPDVVIMDYRLPGMNGIESAKAIRECDGEAKFIFISADASIEAEARSLGILAFKKKPFNLDELKTEIDKVRPRSGS